MDIKKMIAEAKSKAYDKDEIVSFMDNLHKKCKYVTGSMLDGSTEIDDSAYPAPVFGDYLMTFENAPKDLDLASTMKYARAIYKVPPVEGKGYEFKDYLNESMDDEDLEERLSEDRLAGQPYVAFCTLTIYPNDFDGDFDAIVAAIDKYCDDLKAVYEEIKASVDSDKLKAEIEDDDLKNTVVEALRSMKGAEVVDVKQTGSYSHATFSSNSTSYGTYTIKIPIKGITTEWFDKNADFVATSLLGVRVDVPKPKAGLYSTITGATVDDLREVIKQGFCFVDTEVLYIPGLPYEDLFIGD